MFAREHQVEHHIPVRTRKLRATEMMLADAAHLLAETDLCDQRPPRIVRVLRKPVLAAAGPPFLNLVDPRLDLGNVLARDFFLLNPPWRDPIVTLRPSPSL